MSLIANARMYAVNRDARLAWFDLFAWLSRASGVQLEVIDHAFPAALSELWERPDLGCAFICGFPFARSTRRLVPIAAPIPSNSPVPGQPRYTTHLVVRADAPYRSLPDTFGGRVGWTAIDSHSGFNALRQHLLGYRSQDRPALYRESIGPLHTPRRVIEAIISGTIDVGPLDSYALDLMFRHEPDLQRQIKVVASTEEAPMPFLIASSECHPATVEELRASLLSIADAKGCAELLDRLCLSGFSPVQAEDYKLTLYWDKKARKAGYPHPT